MKSAMVYRVDGKTLGKEPIGIVLERRKAERENNAVGLLRLARKEFAETEEEAKRIVIGECV